MLSFERTRSWSRLADWLRELRAAGLASLDSSPKRAAKRTALAAQALQDAETDLR